MGPDDDDIAVPARQLPQIGNDVGILVGAWERRVDVAVQHDGHADLGGEVQDPIERFVLECCDLAGDLRRDELLVDRELADSREHPREDLQHPADVVRGVHIGRVEAGDHRIESLALFRRQLKIRVGDDRVGEGVVVERRVGLRVVLGSEVASVGVHPLLLQGNAAQHTASHLVAHDLQEAMDVGSFLDVVGEVKV